MLEGLLWIMVSLKIANFWEGMMKSLFIEAIFIGVVFFLLCVGFAFILPSLCIIFIQ